MLPLSMMATKVNGIMATTDEEDVIAECVTAVLETETQQRVGGKRKRSLSGSGGEEKTLRAKKRMNGMSTREVGEEGGEIDPRLERVVILDAGAQYGKVTEHFVLFPILLRASCMSPYAVTNQILALHTCCHGIFSFPVTMEEIGAISCTALKSYPRP